MVPDGFSGMDQQTALLLGEIKGQLASLIREFEDHRDQTRESAAAQLQKLEHMEVDVNSLKGVVPSMQSQVYSNKSEIDRVKGDVTLIKSIYAKATGAIAVLWTIAALTATGIWWALTHWGDALSLVKSLFGWK